MTVKTWKERIEGLDATDLETRGAMLIEIDELRAALRAQVVAQQGALAKLRAELELALSRKEELARSRDWWKNAAIQEV